MDMLLQRKSSGKKQNREEKYVVKHLEMASLKMVGHWLDKSGWDSEIGTS